MLYFSSFENPDQNAAGKIEEINAIAEKKKSITGSVPFLQDELKLNLEHLKHCREAIRKHLIDLDPHAHLFNRIPQLGLPSLLTDYLLFDISLETGQQK